MSKRDEREDEPKIRRVLVGADERELGGRAVEAAPELAAALKAELAFVHALGLPEPLRGVGGMNRWLDTTQDLMEHARGVLLERLRGALDAGRDGDPERLVSVVPGRPAEVLLRQLEEEPRTLLLLGAHRHTSPLDFGGTARAVLAHSRAPVWVQPVEWKPIRKVLVALGLAEEDERVLGAARRIARALGASMELFHAYEAPFFGYDADLPPEVMPHYVVDDLRDEDRKAFDELRAAFDPGGVETTTHWVEQEATGAILERAADFDLVVLGTHGRSGFLHAVLGSTAQTILKEARTPALVVPLAPLPEGPPTA